MIQIENSNPESEGALPLLVLKSETHSNMLSQKFKKSKFLKSFLTYEGTVSFHFYHFWWIEPWDWKFAARKYFKNRKIHKIRIFDETSSHQVWKTLPQIVRKYKITGDWPGLRKVSLNWLWSSVYFSSEILVFKN